MLNNTHKIQGGAFWPDSLGVSSFNAKSSAVWRNKHTVISMLQQSSLFGTEEELGSNLLTVLYGWII